MFKRILLVCIGNICRSPTAEALFKHELHGRGFTVSSAGLGALVNSPVDPTALELLKEHGVDHSEHRARQLDHNILSQNDLVLVMEKKHLHTIQTQYPTASGKTFLLGKWLGDKEVPDPYRQQRPAFEHAFSIIQAGTESWIKRLR